MNPADQIGQSVGSNVLNRFFRLRLLVFVSLKPFAEFHSIIFRLAFARPKGKRERYGGDGAEKDQEDSSPFHETILREQG